MAATINKHPVIIKKSVLKGANRYHPLLSIVLKTRTIIPSPMEIMKTE